MTLKETLVRNDAFVAVACEDETLRVFSTVSGQELHELMGHEGRVSGSCFNCSLLLAECTEIDETRPIWTFITHHYLFLLSLVFLFHEEGILIHKGSRTLRLL